VTPKNEKTYAVYEGEVFICMGTIPEIMSYVGISRDSVYKAIKCYRDYVEGKLPKRIIFCLDEGEENA